MSKKGKSKPYSVRVGGRQISKRFRIDRVARQWQAKNREINEQIKAGIVPTSVASNESFLKFAAGFMKKRAKSNPRSTWEIESTRLERDINPKVGHLPINQIATATWEHVLDTIQREQELSDATRNRYRALLSAIYRRAVKDRICLFNPITPIEVLDEGDPEDKSATYSLAEARLYLTTAKEIAELENTDEARSLYGFFLYKFNSGCRKAELTALQIQDIDLRTKIVLVHKIIEQASGQIKFRTKGKRGKKNRGRRYVGLNAPMLEWTLQRLTNSPYKRPTDFLFYGEGGRFIQARKVNYFHEKVVKRAGLPYIRPHDIRHSYGRHFVTAGGKLEDLREILGHNSQAATDRYAHYTPEYMSQQSKMVEIEAPSENVFVGRFQGKTGDNTVTGK